VDVLVAEFVESKDGVVLDCTGSGDTIVSEGGVLDPFSSCACVGKAFDDVVADKVEVEVVVLVVEVLVSVVLLGCREVVVVVVVEVVLLVVVEVVGTVQLVEEGF